MEYLLFKKLNEGKKIAIYFLAKKKKKRKEKKQLKENKSKKRICMK